MKFDKSYIFDAIQQREMKEFFPQFKVEGHNQNYSFIGALQPSDNSSIYTIRIDYRYKNKRQVKIPEVFIICPEIENRIHIYPDGSLCLYHPKNFKWNHKCSIAKTIIPWTCTWLYYYEKYLKIGVWLGDEELHEILPKNNFLNYESLYNS